MIKFLKKLFFRSKDKEVERILAALAVLVVHREFAKEKTLTQAQADAIDLASSRPASKIKGRQLPSRSQLRSGDRNAEPVFPPDLPTPRKRVDSTSPKKDS